MLCILYSKLFLNRTANPLLPQSGPASIQSKPHCDLTTFSELYNHKANGDPSVLNCTQTDTGDDHPILRREVEAAVQSLKKGKSAGVNNIPAELVQAGGEDVITALTKICNKNKNVNWSAQKKKISRCSYYYPDSEDQKMEGNNVCREGVVLGCSATFKAQKLVQTIKKKKGGWEWDWEEREECVC